MRSSIFFDSTPYNITILKLAEFEDLYYATCAKLKELYQGVEILIANGFKSPGNPYFTYQSTPLAELGAVKIDDFKASLLVYEDILYSYSVRQLLNKGILERSRHDDIKNSEDFNKRGAATSVSEHGQNSALYHATRNDSEGHMHLWHGVLKQKRRWRLDVGGLRDIRNMSCGMIFGQLAEKYRPLVMSLKSEAFMIDRSSTPKVPRTCHRKSIFEYVNPYNLDERAKKLNTPGGPELPCICDPDCVCAPLCASEPSQNCLCEENGLFARVTEGMNIDDLDVPDLVRCQRQVSESSESNTSSPLTTGRGFPSWQAFNAAYRAAVSPFLDHHLASSEVEEQRKDQRKLVCDNTEELATTSNLSCQHDQPEGVKSISGKMTLPYAGNDDMWGRPYEKPPWVSSPAYRDALRKPFAKLCDYPPKRSSVAKRTTSSSKSRSLTGKRRFAISQGQCSQAGSGNICKVVKKGSKRELADTSSIKCEASAAL